MIMARLNQRYDSNDRQELIRYGSKATTPAVKSKGHDTVIAPWKISPENIEP